MNVPCVDTKRAEGLPADWTERAARRAAPLNRAMATIVMELSEGVEMNWG